MRPYNPAPDGPLIVVEKKLRRPHEAREDTVLFPAFRSVVSAHEYRALGMISRKKRMICSARMATSKSWIRLRNLKKGWEFMTFRSSRLSERKAPEGRCLYEFG